MELSKQSKTRKPNWSESELHALTQGVSENINIIRGKFGPSLTSETKNKCWLKIRVCQFCKSICSAKGYGRSKKKWQDIQSIAKKKEAARVKSARSTGGGPPPEDFSKSWEQVVIGTLTKSMVEGIEGGEDTSITDRIINSDCVNIEEENVLDSDPVEVITVQNIKPVKEIKQTTSKRDIDGYEEPYDDAGMSEDEEDYLDFLLGDDLSDQEDGSSSWNPEDNLVYLSSQSSVESEVECATGIYWKDDNTTDNGAPDPRTVQFKPKRKPGMQLGRLSRQLLKELKSPINFFRLFMTGTLITSLCLTTNQHASYLIRHGGFKSYAGPDGLWVAITEQEMEKFIGILIYMSFMKFNSVDRYWSKDVLYKFNPISSAMTCSRFRAILAFLQITPLPDVDKSNKLTRVEPLIDHVRSISKELFQPYEKIAVDERIVKSKHKMSGIRQYMKDKPVKFGIKLWVLADTITGYTCDFYVYLGKKRTQITNLSKGLAYAVVMNLMPNYFDQGYRLFIDSFYTTSYLIKDLLSRKVYTIGAVRSNSTALPSIFKKKDGWEKLVSRGDFRWHRENNFLTVQWKDCKVVTIVSPIHCGSKLSTCTRTFQGRTGWKRQLVKQPDCIHCYNEGMFGVDKSNQYLSKYQCYIKTKFHWWKVLFFHCLDIMIVNSFISFQEFRKEYPSKVDALHLHFGQLEFRECLVRALLDLNRIDEKKPECVSCLPVLNEKSARLRCSFCYSYAKMHSLPIQHNKSVYKCEKCCVSLCLNPDRNCFKKWHSEEGKCVQAWARENSRNKDCV